MILAFELTMPNRGSWNGKWSGEGNRYIIIKTFTNTKKNIEKVNKILEKRDYFYSWSDGWGANVSVKLVDSGEAAKLRRRSKGFCGYNWMVDSIINHQKIMNSIEEEDYLNNVS